VGLGNMGTGTQTVLRGQPPIRLSCARFRAAIPTWLDRSQSAPTEHVDAGNKGQGEQP
jgi:hypothetical protein